MISATPFSGPGPYGKALYRRLILAVAALSMLTVGPVRAGDDPIPSASPPPVSATSSRPDRDRARMNQRVFDQVWSEVQRDYYDPSIHGLDWRAVRATYRPQALAATGDGALYRVLDRMLDLLNDDHAGVAPPAAVRRQDLLRERHPVMGVTLYPENDGVYRIERVRAGSPAEEAGVRVGWRLRPDDNGWSPDLDVVDGQAIALRFIDSAGAQHDVTVIPREMDALPAFVADRSRPGVLVLRVEGFEPGLGDWMGDQLADLPADTDVVLDLRANPGGLLMEADAVLSCFLPDRQVWATRTSRSGRAFTLRVQPGCGTLEAPASNALAVLVDRSSRSAAELTPAALQEAGRAVIVGEKTAGAVLISQDSRLPDGGRLTLSRSDFVTRGGIRLEKRGVAPDVTVTDADEPASAVGPDPALDAAVATLRERDVTAGGSAARALSVQASPF
jgi:carboxyl-terminal processing protease